MELQDGLKNLAIEMLNAHQAIDFDALSRLMDPTEIAKPDTFFTQDKFYEVCDGIKEKCGELKSIEYIDCLNKSDYLQTLWKVKYTKTNQEMLWQINVIKAADAYKIVSMSIN
ncbi:MAG: hypothetical protein OEZ58_11105 [Gammaproteobacteria bacterium]|nr:hypothetical protein [Gammaproteobacteria bacterium]MDH5729530.1 hypothetical protein [Gammaproteobacteria bacterium]